MRSYKLLFISSLFTFTLIASPVMAERSWENWAKQILVPNMVRVLVNNAIANAAYSRTHILQTGYLHRALNWVIIAVASVSSTDSFLNIFGVDLLEEGLWKRALPYLDRNE